MYTYIFCIWKNLSHRETRNLFCKSFNLISSFYYMVRGFFLTFSFFKQSSILAVSCFRLRHNRPKLTHVDETRLTRKNDYEMKESKSREKNPDNGKTQRKCKRKEEIVKNNAICVGRTCVYEHACSVLWSPRIYYRVLLSREKITGKQRDRLDDDGR